MRQQLAVTSAATALAIVSLAGLANAVQPARLSVAATFSSHDKTGCISTEISVFARKGGAGQERLELRILRADECNDAASVNIEDVITLPAGSLRVAADLSSATLNTSAAVADRQSRGKVTATLQLKWNATEATVTAMRGEEPDGLGAFIHMRKPVKRAMRLSAASGTIYLNGSAIALSKPDSAWIARAEGGVPLAQ